jgi:hypothetical protein
MTGTGIGIFAFGSSPIEHMPAGRTRALLAEAALQGAELVFFSAADCDLRSGRIRTTRWTRSGWESGPSDLPGLVNIITNPITEHHQETDAWLRKETRIVGFHNHDKLELAALLRASPWADYLIPHAKLDAVTLTQDLTGWLGGGPTVVKPIDGERGRGIHFAISDGAGWTWTRGSERHTGNLSETVARIETGIRGRMRYRDYLAQRFIESRDAMGRAAAIRIDIVRLPQGGWGVFRFVARLAGPGKMVSNLMAGGAQQMIDVFLSGRSARNSEEIREEALALATGVADTLNRNGEPNFEYGVDIVIDRADRLWFIEANGQPQGNWAEHQRAELVIAYLLSLAHEAPSARSQ